MKRRPLVLRVSAVCLSVALAGAYIAYRVTNARRAAAPGPNATGPALAQPPRHFGGSKREEIFDVTPVPERAFFVGSKSGPAVTPGDLEGSPRTEPAEEQAEPVPERPPPSDPR